MQQPKRIVLLAGQWDTTPLVYNFLRENFGIEKAIIEVPVARKEFLKRRAKKLGWITVGGQVLFQLLIAKPLSLGSRKRIARIIEGYGLNPAAIPEQLVNRVPSVNADACLEQLKKLQPDLVVVHGTRIISKRVLQGVSCPFINIHAGITPRYRGSHGAYWALASGDKENCGVTVHLVDPGIDTGNILLQGTIPVSRDDNFTTYPYLQLAEGLILLKTAVHRLFDGSLQPVQNCLNSALWHHPTFWGYAYKWFSKGVR